MAQPAEKSCRELVALPVVLVSWSEPGKYPFSFYCSTNEHWFFLLLVLSKCCEWTVTRSSQELIVNDRIFSILRTWSLHGTINFWFAIIKLFCARIYRPSFLENKPKTLVFNDWKLAYWACFRENWVKKFGYWWAEMLQVHEGNTEKENNGYLSKKALSVEMNPAEARFIRQAFIKERGP